MSKEKTVQTRQTIKYTVVGMTGEQKVTMSEKFIDAINEIFEENDIHLNKNKKIKAKGYFDINLEYEENGFKLHIQPKVKAFKKQFENVNTVSEISQISGFKTGFLVALLGIAVKGLAPEVNKEWTEFIKERIAIKLSELALTDIIAIIKKTINNTYDNSNENKKTKQTI